MKKILILIALALPFAMAAQDAAKLKTKVAAGDTKAMLQLARCYEAGHGVEVDTAKAVALVRQAMEAGDADAKAVMSWYCIYYPPFHNDTATALRLAQESMAAGSAQGMARMAIWYQEGIGMQRNYGKAWRMLEDAAARGSQTAVSVLAAGYLYGDDSIDYDPEMALACIKKLDENCYSSKFELMSTYLLLKGDRKGSWKWLCKGAAMDNAGATGSMIYSRFMGWGTEEDEQGAFQEMERMKAKFGTDHHGLMMLEYSMRMKANDSALRDSARCLEILLRVGNDPSIANYDELAISYMYGTLTGQDSAMAELWWRRGVAKTERRSMVQLAILLINRGEVDSALHYANMAYDVQDDSSPSFVGRCWLYGRIDGKEDRQKAKRYFIESARRGNTEDLVMAGKISLWDGDTAGAFELFDRAIALGHVDAWVNKAYTYIESGDNKTGIGLLKKGVKAGSKECLVSLGDLAAGDENYKQAAKYYEQADNGEGCYKLARLYLYGAIADGGESDVQRGVELLRKGMAYGYDDAAMMLAVCYLQGAGVTEMPDSARIIYEQLAKGGNTDALLQLAALYADMNDSLQAIATLERAVNAGSVTGMLVLGDKLIEGEYLPADTARAIRLYHRAADLEPLHQGVQVAYAEMYLNGIGYAVDTATAIPYLRRAADGTSGWAMAELGDMFYYGRGGMEKDYDSAMAYYHRASDQDNPRGDYMVGMYLDNNGNAEAALTYYVSAARNGNHDAYVEVARAMQNGSGVEANPEQAFEMAQKASTEWEHPDAMMLLGYAYLVGSGTEQDTNLGLQYTRRAADLGSRQAMLNMGAIYGSAYGVERDTVAMEQWYMKAAEAGSVSAMMRLARMYQDGKALPEDKKRAAELYQMAADRGNTEAMCRLGLCYEEGEGVVLNSRKAFNLYTKAADRGSSWGMLLVAFCYAEGIYVKEDDEQTFQWMLKAAEAGSLQACYYTGMLYARGEGVKKNKKEAKKWLSIAAENGMEQAQEALESL